MKTPLSGASEIKPELNRKPRLNDQTFSYNIVLEEHVLLFSCLSQQNFNGFPILICRSTIVTQHLVLRGNVWSSIHLCQLARKSDQPETEFRWRRRIFSAVIRKKRYVGSLCPKFACLVTEPLVWQTPCWKKMFDLLSGTLTQVSDDRLLNNRALEVKYIIQISSRRSSQLQSIFWDNYP